MKKLIWLLLAAALLCLASGAAAEEPAAHVSGEYAYVLREDGSAEITGYRGRSAELTIPAALDGHPVTAIGPEAFTWSNDFTGVTLPDSVTVIAGNNPFRYAAKLTEIRVSPEHPVFAAAGGVLFSRADRRLVCYPRGLGNASYAIPRDVRIIGDSAFYGCRNLTGVTLPDSVAAIGADAFSGCERLTDIVLPDSVAAIGSGAFSGCDSLTGVTIPDSVTDVGSNPFAYCGKLTEIRVSPEHPALVVADGVLFSRQDRRLICYPCAFANASYAIPRGVRIIG